MDIKKFGKFIKLLREENNMTQEDLSKKVSIGREAISKWERGKTLPDITMLTRLSDIFDVSIDELIAGERNTKKNVTLELYADSNKKRKALKLSLFIIFVSLFSFFIYYFFYQYNSTKVYDLRTHGEYFDIDNGLIIFTPEWMYFNTGVIKSDDHKEIKTLELYYQDGSKNKLIDKIDDEVMFFYDYNGYNEYFDFDKFEDIIDNLYIKIYYDDSFEDLKLDVLESYSNNKLFFKKNLPVSYDEYNEHKSLSLDGVMDSKYIGEDGNYHYELKEGDYTYYFMCDSDTSSISIDVYKDEEPVELYLYAIDFESLDYHKYKNDKELYSFNYHRNYGGKCYSESCPDEKDMAKQLQKFYDLVEKIKKEW